MLGRRVPCPQGRCRAPANRLKDGPYAPVAQLDRALPSEGKGHTFESCRVRHLRYSEGLAGVRGLKQGSRSYAVSLWLPTKNIENNPMQSSRRSLARARPLQCSPQRVIRCSAIQNNVQTKLTTPDGPERHRRFYLAVLIGRGLRPVNPDGKHAALELR